MTTTQRTRKGTYEADQGWARRFEDATRFIISAHVHLLADIHFDRATTAKDRACIGDFCVQVQNVDILSRVRDNDVRQRDLTLRSWRKNDIETEVSKIVGGAGKWYFYGWRKPSTVDFTEWMVVDLDILRATSWIQDRLRYPTRNTDNSTAFIAIPRAGLEHIGAIRVQQKMGVDGDARLLFDTGVRFA
jgi:hypothetical protein